MRLDVPDLSDTGVLEGLSDRPESVAQIVAATAARSGDVPFLLLPVRIETRFAQAEVPVADTTGTSATADLAAALASAADRLAALAERRHVTVLPPNWKARKEFKRTVEDPIVAASEADLEAVADVVQRVGPALLRDLAGGDAADAEAVGDAVARIVKAMPKSRTALEGLRSDFHRERLLARFDALTVPAGRLAAQAPARAKAAAAVGEASRAGVPAHRLTESALAFDKLTALVRDPRALASAPARVEWARQLCTQIAAVPPEWKARLAADVRKGNAPAALVEAIDALATTEPTDPGGRPDVTIRTHVVDQLRVRVFPDDVAVRTHEQDLTADEVASGETYWTARASGGGDEVAARAAWRALCLKHGPNRAAWVARQTRPAPPADADDPRDPFDLGDPHAGERRDVTAVLAAMRRLSLRLQEVAAAGQGRRSASLMKAIVQARDAILALDPVPAAARKRLRSEFEALMPRLRVVLGRDGFDILTDLQDAVDGVEVGEDTGIERPKPRRLRTAMWTTPPRAGLLPDRFVVVTVGRDGRISHLAAGNPVPADLPLGLDPNEERPEGDDSLPTSLRWMVDYTVAEDSGMAITVEITPEEAAAGFARVYVLGLAPGDDPAATAAGLVDLLDGHHYGPTGLAVAPVGTPTNATEKQMSGYRSRQDPDVAFDLEQGGGLVTAGPANGDGARLARALGVPAEVFDHIAGADAARIDAAVTANTALWPATLGYALAEELGAIIGLESRESLRRHAVRYALGCGTLPTIRVGSQPYGVLTTTAFSRWEPHTPDGSVMDETAERVLHDVLSTMAEDWTAVRDDLVPHAHSPNVADPQQHVLEVLGLNPTATTFEQRFTVNAGRRGAGVAGATLHLGLPPDGSPGPAAGAYALLDRFADVLRRAGMGSGPLRTIGPKGRQSDIADPWADLYERLETSRAYEVRLLRETVPLAVAGAPDDLSARVAGLLGANLLALAQRPAEARREPLVQLLLRQALLAQARETALRIAVTEGLLDADVAARLGSGDLFTFVTRSGNVRISRWSVLLAELAKVLAVVPSVPTPTGAAFAAYLTGSRRDRLADYVAGRGDNALAANYPSPGAHKHEPLFAPAREHADAVAALAAMPPAQVDGLVAEHLDVCSHRLDAWLLSLPAARLDVMRSASRAPAQGLHAGAFGWVEDLTPRPTAAAASAVPPVLDTDPTRPPIRVDPANQGFVHAPSLNHAATAAVLRAGYATEQAAGADAGGTTPRQLAVNLSSRRVRTALDVLDGIAAGNELGALLGYLFERDLHEAPHAFGLDRLLTRLRRAFPSVVPVVEPDGTTPTPTPTPTPDDDRRAERLVVDGLVLLRTVQARITRGEGTLLDDLRAGSYAAWPYGLADTEGPLIPSAAETADLEAVLLALDHLADTLDAVGDLVLTEGVHQLVQGNHVRAAAALSALAEGTVPPRPEVVDTPVPGRRVEHRLLLSLPPVADPHAAGALAAGWEAVPLTPRACAEPTLNRWLGTLIGPPGATRIRVVDAARGTFAREVTLTALGRQPIDLLACLHDGYEDGLPELGAAVLDAVRPIDVRDGEPVPALRVDVEAPGDGTWPDGVRSLPETAALLEQVAAMLTAGRPADAGDLLLAETVVQAAPGTSAGTPGGVDVDQLAARANTAVAALEALDARLLGLISDGAAGAGDSATPDRTSGAALTTVATYRDVYRGGVDAGQRPTRLDALWLRRGDLRDAVLAAGSFGIRGVAPPTRWTSRTQVATDLLDAAEAAYVAVAERLGALDRLGGVTAGAPREVLRAVFGDSLPVLPLFTPRNPGELHEALAARITADPPGVAVSRWLTGVAEVREGAAALCTALALGDAFGCPPPAGRPVQLPVVAGDTWLGETFPDSQPPGDRLSLVVLGADTLDVAGRCAGVLVDSWSEAIPTGTVTTGVTFHYDSPDATAPQTLLLAVPPVAGRWTWEDLLLTLHETLELAKNRAVEPQHLHHLVYGQLLPGLLGEVPASSGDTDPPPQAECTSGPGIGTGGHRVVLDFADARAGQVGS